MSLQTSCRLVLLTLAAVMINGCSERNRQPPLFIVAPGSPIPVPQMPGNIALGDVNGDAKLDLAVVSGSGVHVLLGQGDGRPISKATA